MKKYIDIQNIYYGRNITPYAEAVKDNENVQDLLGIIVHKIEESTAALLVKMMETGNNYNTCPKIMDPKTCLRVNTHLESFTCKNCNYLVKQVKAITEEALKDVYVEIVPDPEIDLDHVVLFDPAEME